MYISAGLHVNISPSECCKINNLPTIQGQGHSGAEERKQSAVRRSEIKGRKKASGGVGFLKISSDISGLAVNKMDGLTSHLAENQSIRR